ncbi:hypothetical protein SASPL_146663 [Salvia splendens]|uniref:Uncharacterized protein n=1 Tax=Salvia splendens TaxID=180675 RepID=A0A8X8Z5Z9_SALSN|nr:hypothetical protein SASPL_146663 [Salvia splendens]
MLVWILINLYIWDLTLPWNSTAGLILVHLFFNCILEFANVFSCAYLINMVRPSHRKISMKHQKALWYSGLRGAMAFALALQSVHDLPEGHGQTIFAATTAIVVLTVNCLTPFFTYPKVAKMMTTMIFSATMGEQVIDDHRHEADNSRQFYSSSMTDRLQ